MTINVVAIEETENLLNDIGKFTKNVKIENLNIPEKSRDEINGRKNLRYFLSKDVKKQVKELERLREDFDVCIVSSWNAAKLAYLADLHFIMFFIGNDIRIPPFIKNSKPKYFLNSVNKLNFFQRLFFKKVFENASICVTGSQELFLLLNELRNDAKRIDRFVIDTDTFNPLLNQDKKKRVKFSFFSPQRIGKEKGTDILWEAIKLTKSEFEVLQVEWIDDKTQEIKKESLELINNKPKKVKLVPKIQKNEMPKFYFSSDAVLGEMQSGHLNYTECEAVMCKKPVLCYNDLNCKYLINGKEITSPFIPNEKNPENLAILIDKIVTEETFRNNLLNEEEKFISEIADPIKAASEWEELFKIQNKKFNLKESNTSKFRQKIRMIFYKIAFLGVSDKKIH